jgi:protein-tyrosine phosphatase
MSPCSTEYSHNNALVPCTGVSITSFSSSSLPCSSGNHIHRMRPFPNSYWATPLLVACEYPWTPMVTGHSQKIDLLLRAGVRTFIDLTESGELCPYEPHLAAHVSRVGINEEHEPVEYYSFPIEDRSLPRSVGYVRQILDVLKDNATRGRITAVHCRGGIGRTGLVVGCWLVESGTVEDGAAALKFIAEEWKSVEKYRRFPQSPETGGQCEFVLNFERLQGSLVVPISP